MHKICSVYLDNLTLFNWIQDEMKAGSSLKLRWAPHPKGVLSALFSTLNRV